LRANKPKAPQKVHNQGNQNIVRPPMSDGELALISKYISMELFANLPTVFDFERFL
jgi:hypothetical protein